MKIFINFFVFISMLFVTSCVTKNEIVENNYYVWTDGEYVQVDEDPTKADKEVADDSDNQATPDIESDTSTDSDVSTDTETDDPTDNDFVEQTDGDSVTNYCVEMVDSNGESMERDYSDGVDTTNTKTILTIELQTVKETCLMKMFSNSIPLLNGFSIETTVMPIRKMPIVFENKDCYLYVEFSSANSLTIQIMEISTLDLLVDQTFLPK